jgi:hypothetical protein
MTIRAATLDGAPAIAHVHLEATAKPAQSAH